MESANLHQQQHRHHHQLQVVASSSSSSSPPNIPSSAAATNYYGAAIAQTTTGGGGPHPGWTQNFTFDGGSVNPRLMMNNTTSTSTSTSTTTATTTSNPAAASSSMLQHHNHHDLSFQWNTHSGCFTSIKDVEEGGSLSSSTSTDPFPRFTDMLISSPSPSSATGAEDTSSSCLSSSANDLSEKLLLKTISGFPALAAHHYYQGGGVMPFMNPSSFANVNFGNSGYFMVPAAGRVGGSGNTSSSFIYPSINVSSLNQETAPLDMNMQALDLLAASSNQSLMGSHLRIDHNPPPNYGCVDNHHLLQENLTMRQYCNPSSTKVSSGSSSTASFNRETATTEAKRSSSGSSSNEATAGKGTSQQPGSSGANKKSRLDQPRASCPPFKVRKEKLGDRIAALQQLVAPFGKTDTASVLMEAIGYIKFLQNQVETLSVPYMKSNRNKPTRPMHFQTGATGEATSRDLRSRGLCLVPLSCMSYVTSIDGGSIAGAMWPPPPPNFGSGT